MTTEAAMDVEAAWTKQETEPVNHKQQHNLRIAGVSSAVAS